MDPITVIVTALVAGAAAGGSDAAAAAVRDAYTAIRNRLSQAGHDTASIIEANETAPGENVAAIEAAVRRNGLGDDRDTADAAQRLLAHLPTERIDQARSLIDLSHARGVQLGDHNIQNNKFN
ncbi:hypothetical protein [Nocardia gipuzkoensis]|uniref:hypothetical protein n=1 Tax=Nocardia gipuzkoensis TaxID=2749991 RepID=UPI0015EE521A|nr:hypothetical protein [Nocardia gipuzkoensis]